ncbi:MAG TPA: ion transporter [Verrucomicrobiales bacterium]|nr:ion transporter [Verrucomicrobiales bacterium]
MKSADSQGLGRAEKAIQVVIILSLVTFALETLPGLLPWQRRALAAFEMFSIAVFTIEYLVRLSVARPVSKYAFSFFGIVDLLAILPFYLSAGFDLRSLRAFRLLRLLRVLKLARYSRAMQRFHRAFIIAKEELVLFGATACILLYLAAVGIYYFENAAQPQVFTSLFDGLWWAISTLTTVGYGDAYPITAGGRFFTFFILIIGLGVIAVPTGLIASALSKARREEDEEEARALEAAAIAQTSPDSESPSGPGPA